MWIVSTQMQRKKDMLNVLRNVSLQPADVNDENVVQFTLAKQIAMLAVGENQPAFSGYDYLDVTLTGHANPGNNPSEKGFSDDQFNITIRGVSGVKK